MAGLRPHRRRLRASAHPPAPRRLRGARPRPGGPLLAGRRRCRLHRRRSPGSPPEYGPDYYGGFLLDPDGNSAEACHHATTRRGGIIDHVWIRVADVARGPRLLRHDRRRTPVCARTATRPSGCSSAGATGSFSLFRHRPPATEYLHMAFGTRDDGDIERFHQAAIEAGYESNGGPASVPATTPATTPRTSSTRRQQHRGREPPPRVAFAA